MLKISQVHNGFYFTQRGFSGIIFKVSGRNYIPENPKKNPKITCTNLKNSSVISIQFQKLKKIAKPLFIQSDDLVYKREFQDELPSGKIMRYGGNEYKVVFIFYSREEGKYKLTMEDTNSGYEETIELDELLTERLFKLE